MANGVSMGQSPDAGAVDIKRGSLQRTGVPPSEAIAYIVPKTPGMNVQRFKKGGINLLDMQDFHVGRLRGGGAGPDGAA